MINSAFIVPHSPLLIPAIAKGNAPLIEKTAAAYDEIKQLLSAQAADHILIISPHGAVQPDAFVLQAAWEFQARFEEFGDFASKAKWSGDPETAYHLKESIETEFPAKIASETNLDYGSAIPLFRLLPEIAAAVLVPLAYSGRSLAEHIRCGELIGEVLQRSPKNWTIIASGDLSHRLTHNAPAGYSPKAAKFDNKLIEYLSEPESAAEQIGRIEPKLAAEVRECGLKSIALLSGIIKGRGYRPQVLSYQSDLGIGYLTMSFTAGTDSEAAR